MLLQRTAVVLACKLVRAHTTTTGSFRGYSTPASAIGSGQLAVIGVPFSKGQPRPGADRAPAQLRSHGLITEIKKLGWEIHDEGDMDFIIRDDEKPEREGKIKNPRVVGAATKQISDVVWRHANAGRFVLTLGGDHSIALGTIAGVLRQDPNACVVWIDAHADINTISTTPTGNMHGMPLSFLLGLNKGMHLAGLDWVPQEQPLLKPDSLAYIGLRDVDAGEKELLHRLGIAAHSMEDVDRMGISHVVADVLHYLGAADGQRSIHLSFDIDALDPHHAPATGTPVTAGLTLREGRYICEVLSQTGRLRSMDMVEINPLLAAPAGVDATTSSAIELLKAALGRRLL